MPNANRPWLTPECRKEIADMIKAEVQTQLGPVLSQVTAVQRENEQQSRDLKATGAAVANIDNWRKKLWGDGITEGFLDKARKEDKAKLEVIEQGFSKMQSGIDNEREKAKAVAEALLQANAAREKALSDAAAVKERKFSHITAILTVVCTLFGGGLLALLGERLLPHLK